MSEGTLILITIGVTMVVIAVAVAWPGENDQSPWGDE